MKISPALAKMCAPHQNKHTFKMKFFLRSLFGSPTFKTMIYWLLLGLFGIDKGSFLFPALLFCQTLIQFFEGNQLLPHRNQYWLLVFANVPLIFISSKFLFFYLTGKYSSVVQSRQRGALKCI